MSGLDEVQNKLGPFTLPKGLPTPGGSRPASGPPKGHTGAEGRPPVEGLVDISPGHLVGVRGDGPTPLVDGRTSTTPANTLLPSPHPYLLPFLTSRYFYTPSCDLSPLLSGKKEVVDGV